MGGGGHSCRGPGERKADQLKGTSPHCRGPVIIPVMGADSTPYIPSLQGASDQLEALSQQWKLSISLFGVSLSRSTNKETLNLYSLLLIHIYVLEMTRGRPRRSAAERRYLPADCRLRESIHLPQAVPVSVDFLDENITPSTTPTDPETSPAREHRRWDGGLPANWSAASLRMLTEELV